MIQIRMATISYDTDMYGHHFLTMNYLFQKVLSNKISDMWSYINILFTVSHIIL